MSDRSVLTWEKLDRCQDWRVGTSADELWHLLDADEQ